jgi:hypothetical protein
MKHKKSLRLIHTNKIKINCLYRIRLFQLRLNQNYNYGLLTSQLT